MNELQPIEAEVVGQQSLFDYATLDVESRVIVQQRTSEIKERARRIASDIVEIGGKLADVRNRLDNGKFKQWLDAEFPEWSQRSAYHFMKVWEEYGSAEFSIDKIAPSGLYLLAAPSTPDAARETVKRLAQEGQAVSYSTVKEIVAQAKRIEPVEDRDGKDPEESVVHDPLVVCLCGHSFGSHELPDVPGISPKECLECECEIYQEATGEEVEERTAAEKALGITPSKSPVPPPGATPASKTITRLKAQMGLEEEEAKKASGEPSVCRVCGCTDRDCSQCVKKTGGPCYWVKDDLCSACAPAGGALTPVVVEVEQADLDAMDHLNAADEMLSGEPAPFYEIDYGPVVVITHSSLAQGQMVEARGWRIIPETEAREFPTLSEGPGVVTSLIGRRVNVGTERRPNWWLVVGPEYEFRLALKSSSEESESVGGDTLPAAPTVEASPSPVSAEVRPATETPSTGFERPENWPNLDIEISIALMPSASVTGRQVVYRVTARHNDEDNGFKGADAIVTNDEDEVLRSLPQPALDCLKYALESLAKGEAPDDLKRHLRREALARYRGVPVESVVLDEDEEDVDGFRPGFPPGFDVKKAEQGLAQEGEADEGNYQAEWLAGLRAEEREKYEGAPCLCGHTREWHEEDGRTGEYNGECSALNCGKTYPVPRCKGYHCRECDTKGSHRATCKHYVLGEGTPLQQVTATALRSPQLNEYGVYVKGVEKITVPMPKKKAGKIELIINLIQDLTDKMWRSSHSVSAGNGSCSLLPGQRSLAFESRELALLEAGEKAREFLTNQARRSDTTEAQKRQIEAAIPVLDEWLSIKAVDHCSSYPDDEIDAPLPEDLDDDDIPIAEEPMLEDALRHALHIVEDAEARWEPLKKNGAADNELMAAIGREWDSRTGAELYGGWEAKGGKSPQFTWFDDGPRYKAQKLNGKRLLAKVRHVLEVGAPKLVETAPADADDFTASRCDECKRIDGAHADTCSRRPNALTFEDYLDYARFTWPKSAESHAREWEVSMEKDAEVMAWKLYWEELKGKGVNPSSDLCLCGHLKAKHDKHVGCLTMLDSGQSCQCVTFVASAETEKPKRAKKGRAAG